MVSRRGVQIFMPDGATVKDDNLDQIRFQKLLKKNSTTRKPNVFTTKRIQNEEFNIKKKVIKKVVEVVLLDRCSVWHKNLHTSS